MTYTIDIRAFTDRISDRVLEQLCRENPELRFETDSKGNLVIMPLRYSLSGMQNAHLHSLFGEDLLPGLIVDLSDIF
jgi:Uma2 family endonuclease